MLYEKWGGGGHPDVWGPLPSLAGPYSVKHLYGRPSHQPSYMVTQVPVMLNGMGKEGKKKKRQNDQELHRKTAQLHHT